VGDAVVMGLGRTRARQNGWLGCCKPVAAEVDAMRKGGRDPADGGSRAAVRFSSVTPL
jgi:hypothetical protein